ncbi:MAG: glycosyltransferase family 39 protein [Anaerolineales bacterium]|nr:glycosyltransferase family 39 protein [Anaerolineales bacterium]
MPKAKRTPAPKPKARRKSPPAKTKKERAGAPPARVRVAGGKAQRPARQTEAAQEALRGTRNLPAWASFIKGIDLSTWLFVGAIVLYLVTRLVGLTRYPIYFFTDEAFQTQTMVELIERGYRDVDGVKFPTYFGAGMGLTVYLQWLPYLLFGKSALATRAVSAVVTVIAAVAVGVSLRAVFQLKYWWSGALFLALTPAWFLHSRTAFETGVFASFYAGALCSYLLYRYRSPRYLYLTVALAALAFYSYNAAQMIVPATALVLFVSDWRYHLQHRGSAVRAAFLLAVLALPYLRYKLDQPDSADEILRLLGSYLVTDLSIAQKVSFYISEYFFGLSAYYWYIPNDRDLVRHLMKDYGHIMLATLPFALLGLAYILRNLREPACRALFLVLLVIPLGGALVQVSITRGLVFTIPAALLTAIGFDRVLRWIENPRAALEESPPASNPTGRRVAASVGILLAGAALAFFLDRTVDRVSIAALAILLGFHGLGLFDKLKGWMRDRFTGWKISQAFLALAAFGVLSVANIRLLTDALKNGADWWTNYSMDGMQYGAFQIYDAIEDYHQRQPETEFIFSPNWTNGADVLNRFFLGVPPWLKSGNIEGYLQRKRPLDENTLFIMLPDEYATTLASPKFTDVRVEQIVRNPDGTPAFYFVRLRYAENIDEVFAAEQAERAVLREAVINVEGQRVGVRFSYLDAVDQAHSVQELFDHDRFTLAKTLEANPFILEMTFPAPRTIRGFSITVHTVDAQIVIHCYSTLDAEPVTYAFEGIGSDDAPTLTFEFPEPTQAQFLHFEMLDPHSPPPAQIHIWELTFAFND